MPRSARNFPGVLVYHVLNRAVARLPLFEKPADYAAFERVLGEALDRVPMRILTYTLGPNHWHLILWPEHGEDDLLERQRAEDENRDVYGRLVK